jgi:hypothetical protein
LRHEDPRRNPPLAGLRRRRTPAMIKTPTLFRSPRNQPTEGGEHMMTATLLIGAACLAAMAAGFIAMIRD